MTTLLSFVIGLISIASYQVSLPSGNFYFSGHCQTSSGHIRKVCYGELQPISAHVQSGGLYELRIDVPQGLVLHICKLYSETTFQRRYLGAPSHTRCLVFVSDNMP